jgi:predicted ATPase
MIKSISFKNYKVFKEHQHLELRPMTVLFGKNNSGKSAITKLLPMIDNSLKGEFEEPLSLNNQGVELGVEFRDLLFGRQIGNLELTIESTKHKLKLTIAPNLRTNESPKILGWNFDDKIDLVFDERKRMYFEEMKEQYMRCSFHGFNLDSVIISENSESSLDSLEYDNFSLKTDYISSYRNKVERFYPTQLIRKKMERIGIDGENVYGYLINDFISGNDKFLSKISDWYEKNFEGWKININIDNYPDAQIELFRENITVNLKYTGQGINQALPLVTRAFMQDEEETIIIIEEPEQHLHPAAHGNLAELFANSTKDNLKHYLVETHSQNFILRLRRLIAEGKFSKDNLALYYVDFDEDLNRSNLKKIEVDENGRVNFWPEGIFSETLEETIAIRTAQIDKQNNAN